MVISVQWLAVGVVGSASLVGAVAALPPPPPLPERVPIVAAAPIEIGATPGCADEVWPRVSQACAGVALAARPVRYVSLGSAAAPAAIVAPAVRIAAPILPAVVPRVAPVAAIAAARRTETRTAKRHGGAGRVREARRAPVVRVSFAPVQAAAFAPSYTIGPRVDR